MFGFNFGYKKNNIFTSGKALVKSITKILGISGTSGLIVDANNGTLVNGRTSTATVADYQGVIQNCKANEIRYTNARRVENLLPHSSYPNAHYSTTVTTTAVASPLTGEMTGARLTPRAELEDHMLLVSTTPGTLSMYAKADGCRYLQIQFGTDALIDLIAVTVVDGNRPGSPDGSSLVSLTSLSNGWVRVAFPVKAETIRLYIQEGTSYTWAGDGVKGMYMTDMQLETGSSASEYIPTGTGILQNSGLEGIKYFDTDPLGNPLPNVSILHEGQGTNILPHSENFVTGGWSMTNAESTSGDPNTVTVLDLGIYARMFKGGIEYTAGSIHTCSINITSLQVSQPWFIRFQGDTVTESVPFTPFLGLNKIHTTLTTIGGSGYFHIFFSPGGVATPGDGFTGTLQLEASTYASSYISTGAAPVTRAADSISVPLALDSNFYQSKGVLLFRFTPGYDETALIVNTYIASIAGADYNLMYWRDNAGIKTFDGANNPATGVTGITSGTTVIFSLVWDVVSNKMAIAYSIDDGMSWSTWITSTYDGAFKETGNFSVFVNNILTNNLHAANVYHPSTGHDIASMQVWVESEANSLTRTHYAPTANNLTLTGATSWN